MLCAVCGVRAADAYPWYPISENISASLYGSNGLLLNDTEDISLPLFNPGMLAYCTEPTLGLTVQPRLNRITFLHPFRKSGLGVSVASYDGTMLDIIENGRLITRYQTQQDNLVTLMYGRELLPGFTAGVSGKLFKSRVFDTDDTTEVMGDASMAWRAPDDRWTAGASLLNINGGARSSDRSVPNPTTWNIGMSYRAFDAPRHTLDVGGAASFDTTNTRALKDVANFGVNYTFNDMLSLRVLYQATGGYTDAFTVGGGFSFLNNRVDFLHSRQGEENIDWVTFTMRFGQPGVFGRGLGYYKKGMYDRALRSFAAVPPESRHGAQAANYLQLCRDHLAAAANPALLSVRSPKAVVEKYPVSVQIMKNVPLAIYHLLPAVDVAPLSVTIGNNTAAPAEFKIVCRYEPKTLDQSTIVSLDAGETRRVNLTPLIPSAVIGTVAARESQIMRVAVSRITDEGELKKLGEDFTDYVTLYPYNQFFPAIEDLDGTQIDTMATIAAWVTPHAPEMVAVASHAGTRGLKMNPPVKITGGQDPAVFTRSLEQKDHDYMKQIELLYQTLVSDYGLTYVNQPVIERPGKFATQRVKLPHETLLYKGNCIELSVLFASLLESVEIDPLLVFLPKEGHCLVGWEVPGDGGSVTHVLETNLFGDDFRRVSGRSTYYMAKYGLAEEFGKGIPFSDDGVWQKDDDVIIYNVKKLHERIPPSPYISR